jgi:hypothetical protein
MNEILTREVLEVNDRLDPRALLDKMGFKGEAIYEEGIISASIAPSTTTSPAAR